MPRKDRKLNQNVVELFFEICLVICLCSFLFFMEDAYLMNFYIEDRKDYFGTGWLGI